MAIGQYLLRVIFLLTSCCLLTACKLQVKKETRKGNQQGLSTCSSYSRDLFGNNHLAIGDFFKNTSDSVETGLWEFVRLDTTVVLAGDFYNGLPEKEWKFVLTDGWLFTSNWNIYENKIISTRFSLPFAYREVRLDSIYFKLRTLNDSLGTVSIIFGVNKKNLEEKKQVQLDSGTEAGLTQMGFRFTKESRRIKNGGSTYYFTEFFMKDSANNNVKCYQVYGNLPSKKGFVEVSVYHMGPREELVKIIFNMIVNHLYVENERFYNPYLK